MSGVTPAVHDTEYETRDGVSGNLDCAVTAASGPSVNLR